MIDVERQQRVQQALKEARLDALVCALPMDVLMLTGYWPVLGISIATVTADGVLVTVVPSGEEEFTRDCAGEFRTYAPASLEQIFSVEEAAVEPLGHILSELKLGNARVGCEGLGAFVPAGYASVHTWGDQLLAIIRKLLPQAGVAVADGVLARLRSTLTTREVQQVREACHVATLAFASVREHLAAGVTERELAAALQNHLTHTTAPRAGGFMYCMSGPNAAKAYRAFQHSSTRSIEDGDLALVHCNSYVNGYWTDITRTYCLGRIDDRKRKVYDAVLAARDAAFSAIRPGVPAEAVDAAARAVMCSRGYAKEFKHPTGHGVGFAAIDHNATPRLHPASDDVLEPGMVFNIEPAAYFDGWGGVRHCDLVAVTESGAALLTDFDSEIESLCLL